jgi:hypothetical protein
MDNIVASTINLSQNAGANVKKRSPAKKNQPRKKAIVAKFSW